MYKFTNGLVFYTKEDAEKAVEAGYHLIEKQLDIEETLKVIDEEIDEKQRLKNEFIGKANPTTKKSNRKDKRSNR